MSKRLTTEEFILNSKLKHGNKYDYSKTNYINWSSKVIIICQKHGEFLQTAHHHSSGGGCKKCVYEERSLLMSSNTEEFIKKAKIIHLDKYDYSKVNYKNSGQKIIIICPKHGEFWTIPQIHLSGHDCPECGFENMCKNMSSNTEEFIEKAKIIHLDKYDYSKVNYTDGKKKIIIICPKHGQFTQAPSTHLKGSGCSDCGTEITNLAITSNTEEFIEKAKIIHLDKYDYSKVNYKNNYSKVNIFCPIHGLFSQRPTNHLRGSGCPICKSSKGELKIKKYLDDNSFEYQRQYKIKECKNQRSLPFDFCVFINDKKYLIEFQGEQHFRAKDWGSKKITPEEKLLKVINNDEIKYNYCQESKINLLLIHYKELDLIQEKLEQYLV